MSNPQCEEGYIKISNDLFDALVRTRTSGEERQCLDFIIRKTYGWNKKEDRISLSQFNLTTGISKPHVCGALKKLEYKKMIFITKNGNGTPNLYSFNKDFDTWNPLPKNGKEYRK